MGGFCSIVRASVVPWPVWITELEVRSVNRNVSGSISSQSIYTWVVYWIPCWRVCRRQLISASLSHRCFSHSPFLLISKAMKKYPRAGIKKKEQSAAVAFKHINCPKDPVLMGGLRTTIRAAVVSWLVWLSELELSPLKQKIAGSISSQGNIYLGCVFNPLSKPVQEAANWCFSLAWDVSSFSFSKQWKMSLHGD